MLWHFHLKAGPLYTTVRWRRFQWHSVARLSVRAAPFCTQTQATGLTQACLEIFTGCHDSFVAGQLLEITPCLCDHST